jgi:hypothetical protein
MPRTISKTADDVQIIGGMFSKKENADNAVDALRELGVPESNLQILVVLDNVQNKNASSDGLVESGFAESQAQFYSKALRDGKILVAVHNVTDPAPVIEVFDDNGAEYNPDGSRNVREDVVGMTAGAAAGAIAGGAAGTAAAGPLGGAIGAVAGAVVGGGAGAAAGKATEHHK